MPYLKKLNQRRAFLSPVFALAGASDALRGKTLSRMRPSTMTQAQKNHEP